LQPAAEFLELGLSPSNSEKFLTPPISNGFFPKGSNGAQKKATGEIFFNPVNDKSIKNKISVIKPGGLQSSTTAVISRDH